MEIDLKGNIIKTLEPKQFKRQSDYFMELDVFRYAGENTFCIFPSDTIYHFDRQTFNTKPIFASTGLDKKGGWYIMYDELPNRYLISLFTLRTPEENRKLLSVTKDSYKSSEVKLINDFFGNIPAKMYSFYEGYYAASYEPTELMEVIENRLNDPNCTSKDSKFLSDFLKTLHEDDGNILFTGKLKHQQPKKMNHPDEVVPIVKAMNPEIPDIIKDSTICEMPYNTGFMEDMNKFFEENKKFRDWPSNDPRTVFVGHTLWVNGTTSNARIVRSSGVKELDEEAIRLVNIMIMEPSRNENGEFVNSKLVMPIAFP